MTRPPFGSRLRALGAMVHRDWLIYLRYPTWVARFLIWPILFPLGYVFAARALAGPEGGALSSFNALTGTTDYLSYIAISSTLYMWLNITLWNVGFQLRQEQLRGTLESNWLAPLPRPLFLVGQALASLALTALTSAGVVLLGWWLFGFRVTGNAFAALLVAVPLLLALYGFGFAFAGLVLLLKEANTLIDVSDYSVSLLSGSQFPVSVLPPALFAVSLALPLTYGYDAVRGILLGSKTLLPIPYEVGILLGFMVVMGVFGYAVFKRVERRCQRLGTIGMH